MTGTLLIIIALLLILGITIYSYSKNGSEKKMGDKELEDHLKVFIGTDEDNSIQNQCSELIQTVCTSIQAVNSEYESAVYILHFENNQFLLQKGSSTKYIDKIHSDVILGNKLFSQDISQENANAQ